MNYLSALLVICGLFFSTNIDKPSKVNFEKLKDVDCEFVDFLSAFEKTDLPYEMTKDEIIALEQLKPEYRKERNKLLTKYVTGNANSNAIFSRGGPPIIVPLKRFYPSDKTVAVSFLRKQRFTDATAAVMVAVFTLKGKLIRFKEQMLESKFQHFTSSPPLSATDYDQLETFRITENGILHKTTYDKIWEKSRREHGVHDNKVISYELKSQETFEFSDEGYLVSLDKKEIQDISNIALKP